MTESKTILHEYNLSAYINDIVEKHKPASMGLTERVLAGELARTIAKSFAYTRAGVSQKSNGMPVACDKYPEKLIEEALIDLNGINLAPDKYSNQLTKKNLINPKGISFISDKYSKELMKKALIKSKLIKFLSERGTGLSKQGNSFITKEIIDKLKESTRYTYKLINVAGIGTESPYRVPKYVEELPNSPLEEYISKNFHFYQN
jgi:hypothetical protein